MGWSTAGRIPVTNAQSLQVETGIRRRALRVRDASMCLTKPVRTILVLASLHDSARPKHPGICPFTPKIPAPHIWFRFQKIISERITVGVKKYSCWL